MLRGLGGYGCQLVKMLVFALAWNVSRVLSHHEKAQSFPKLS
jgi:hypothetical protein